MDDVVQLTETKAMVVTASRFATSDSGEGRLKRRGSGDPPATLPGRLSALSRGETGQDEVHE